MANPLIDLLEGSAKAAYGFLEEAAASASSANQILRDLSDAGFSIRRQTGLDIIATLRGSLSAARVARVIPPNTIIPETLLPPSPHPLTNNFSYRVKVNNPEIGIPGFINVSSNVTLSLNQIFATATAALLGGDSPTIQGVQSNIPDLTLDRGLTNATLFTDAQVSDYSASQQSTLEPSPEAAAGGFLGFHQF